jgi:hypothetical protein
MAETAALLADEALPERPLSMPMALRFLLANRPAVLSEVLGVVYRTISGHPLARAGVRRVAGHMGAVTLIQRFGLALNLNVHFHMIFVDGAYVTDGRGAPVFRAVRSPGAGELQALVQQMAGRIGRLLENRGLIERDAQSARLSGEPLQGGSLDELIGHCITWRIGIGHGARRNRRAGGTLPGGHRQVERTPCTGATGAGRGVLRSTIGAPVMTGEAGVIARCRAGLASRSRADGGLRRIGARLAGCRQQRVEGGRGV